MTPPKIYMHMFTYFCMWLYEGDKNDRNFGYGNLGERTYINEN